MSFRRFSRPLFALLLALVLGACSQDPLDTLVGCFSTNQNGSQEFRIVEGKDGGYALSWRQLDHWGPSRPLRQATKAELTTLFGADAAKIQASLVANEEGFALHRIQAGETLGQAKTDSGFIGTFFFGAGQVYKAGECL
ncbi:MAG: hypothetical protein R3E68_04230 [Burkholderiaceae bacterium]